MENTSFLPENYQAPKSGNNYTKFEEGETRLRILSKPLLGWVDWHESKPIRVPYGGPESKPKPTSDGIVRHFWAFTVYNYEERAIQVCEVTQATIQEAIKGLVLDSDWGDPYAYDIKIIRTGKGLDTSYTVTPSPKKELSKEGQEAYGETPVNLNALLKGEDPFNVELAPLAEPTDNGDSDELPF